MSKGTPISELGEFGLIARIRRSAGPIAAEMGLGDDAAVLPANRYFGAHSSGHLLVSTDTMVDGRHFRRDFSTASDVGHKLAAVNLSDIAAMGGQPFAALVTLQLPPATEVTWVEELYSGITGLTAPAGAVIVGGDTVSSAELAVGITILGQGGKHMLRRSAGAAGEDVWVSGVVGLAGLGLGILRGEEGATGALAERALARHRRPIPQNQLGRELAERSFARAAIDISDGLLQDLQHLATESGVSLEIELAAIPVPECWSATLELRLKAVTSGDDYELAFTAPAASRDMLAALAIELGVPLTRVGTVSAAQTAALSVRIESGDVVEASELLQRSGTVAGFDHFRSTTHV